MLITEKIILFTMYCVSRQPLIIDCNNFITKILNSLYMSLLYFIICYELPMFQGGHPPNDYQRREVRLQELHLGLFLTACLLTIFGLVLAVFFLQFNVRKRHLKYCTKTMK